MRPTWFMLGNTLLMALQQIRRRTLRSSLTTLGVVIGVAAVIALVTLGEGATDKVTNDISSMGVNMLTIVPGASKRGAALSAAPPFTLADARAISRDVSSVAAVAPFAGSSAVAVYENQSWSTQVTGTTNDYFTVRALEIEHGRRFTESELSSGLSSCVLGHTVASKLFGARDPLGEQIRLGRIACRVIGTIAAKGQSTFGMDQDDFVLLPIVAFQRRVAGSTDVAGITVSAVDKTQTLRAQRRIEALLRERRRIQVWQEDNFEVHDTREIIETLQTITGVLTALLGAVAAVSLLVGGIGIMNIMLVAVTERTREIGIRLAIGARGSEVLLQFLIESIVLCVCGGILGMLLGLGGAFVAGQALDIPFRFLPEVVVIAVAFSGCIGVAFGFLPARNAARLNPIEALRHE